MYVVPEVRAHDFLQDLPVNGWILDRNQLFNPAIEVSWHPVRGREEDLRLGGRQRMTPTKTHDAAVLQEASDEALDGDVLG